MTPTLYLACFLVGSVGFRLVRLQMAISKARAAGRGRRAAQPIFWVMTAAYLIFFGCCACEGWLRRAQFSWLLSILGLVIFTGSLLMRERAMSDLGRFFSPDIEIRNGHRVIREGLYRHIRHPLLACMALEILGLGLVFNAYRSLLFLGLGFYYPLIELRRFLEERTLVSMLGEEYRRYQREVGAFWPKRYGDG